MSTSTELDVDQLMSAIREAALKKHPDLDSHTKHEAIPPALLLHVKQRNEREEQEIEWEKQQNQRKLTLSPEFTFHHNDTYHVNDLLKYHDQDFVRNAYRAILKREPDEAGFLHNLGLLQSGAYNKIDILASLRYSDEGKRNDVTINGLRLPATIRALERIPILGYGLQLLLALVRLPVMVRSQRQFQGYIVAQQLAIADYVNESQRFNNKNERTKAQAQEEHRAKLTSQLEELELALNETVLPRFVTGDQRFTNAEAKLLQLDDRLANVSEMLSRTRQQVNVLLGDVKPADRDFATAKSRTPEELREWDNFYAAFENEFRGSAEEVEERLRFYLPFMKELNAGSKILDLGSGRGDWLKLLRKEGFNPVGIEANAVFAEESRKRGLEVTHGEMMNYLGRQPENSLDLVSAFHLIEHIDSNELIRLLDEIKRTLKPGGRLFIETPSPENIVVAACNFYADPTHHKPINPRTLVFLLKNKGFIELGLQFLHAVDGSPFKEIEGSEQLNMWFYGPRDFAVTARKAH